MFDTLSFQDSVEEVFEILYPFFERKRKEALGKIYIVGSELWVPINICALQTRFDKTKIISYSDLSSFVQRILGDKSLLGLIPVDEKITLSFQSNPDFELNNDYRDLSNFGGYSFFTRKT